MSGEQEYGDELGYKNQSAPKERLGNFGYHTKTSFLEINSHLLRLLGQKHSKQ